MNVGVLFTDNLRLRDNHVLSAACKDDHTVYSFFFHNNKRKTSSEFGMRDISPYQAKFYIKSLQNLRDNLEKHDSHLSIIRGDSDHEIINFAKKYKLQKIYVQESVGEYERDFLKSLKTALQKENISLFIIWDHTLVHKHDLDFALEDMPQVFTHFRKSVEKNSEIEDPVDIPKISSSDVEETDMLDLEKDFGYSQEDAKQDSRRAIEHTGGEDEAWKQLEYYLWESKCLSEYKKTRNRMIGRDYSSKFSAWINAGCISSRSIYAEVKKYEQQITKNSSTYWLIFEILWRDFFQFIFLQDPHRFFEEYPDDNVLEDTSIKRKFEKWSNGNTQVDFVDANMRELNLTGFMSNRGRQNVASYLINDLKLPWQLGAKYFESKLIDYDVASNWGNWAYQAHIGNDPRDNRYFNIEKQASMYDENREFRDLWGK